MRRCMWTEGSEFSVIDHLRQRNVLPLIDELFVELHHSHPDMNAFSWGGFPRKREEARDMLQRLRHEGIYAHSWP